MSQHLSRRNFVYLAMTAAAGAALSACQTGAPAPAPTSQQTTAQPTNTTAPTASSGGAATPTKAAAATPAAGTTPAAGATPTTAAAAAPTATAGGPTPTTAVAAEGALPVPRKETFFSEDTGKFTAFDSFNPFIPNGWTYQAGNIYATEFMWIANFASGEMMPWLATGYKYSDDNKSVTINLNPKATWNDGKPFTSEDVAFTVNMVKGNTKLSGNANYNKYVDSVETPDPNTVVFKLKEANPRFHQTFICKIVSGSYIVPKHIWDGKDPATFKNNPPVWTGAWKLKQVIPELALFVWERNDNYWNKDKYNPAVKYMAFRQAPPKDADQQELEQNKIDHAHALDYPQMQAAQKKNPKVVITPFRDPCPRGMWFNCAAPPTDKAEFRWAMSYLINRDKAANVIWPIETVPAEYPWSDWQWEQKYVDKAVLSKYPLSFDPKKAADLLDKLGYKMQGAARVGPDGKPLQLEIITPTTQVDAEFQIALDIAEEAKKLGIEMSVKSLVGPSFDDQYTTGKFNMTSHWLCGASLEPIELYSGFHSRYIVPIGERALQGNSVRLKSPEFDKLIDQILAVGPDDPKIMPLYSQALDLYMQLLPATPIIQTTYVMAYNSTNWTGWPTKDKMYTLPFTWWHQFNLAVMALKPA